MKYTGNRRITRAVIEMAKVRRKETFASFTDEEIYSEVPIAKSYFYEYSIGQGIGVFVPDCPICGATHLHGAHSNLNGLRSPFCLITDEPIPNNYQLQIDWTDDDNIRLAEKYGLKVGEVE